MVFPSTNIGMATFSFLTNDFPIFDGFPSTNIGMATFSAFHLNRLFWYKVDGMSFPKIKLTKGFLAMSALEQKLFSNVRGINISQIYVKNCISAMWTGGYEIF